MRFTLLAALLCSCAGSSHAAAWPKAHERQVDGGESLAPHEARVVTASKAADDDKPAAPAAVTTTPAATEAKPAAATPPAATSEEPIQAEEIIIEIDD
ncbi:hypothetical protein BH11MYX1_BH11MYX1_24380 [soil metagenome]